MNISLRGRLVPAFLVVALVVLPTLAWEALSPEDHAKMDAIEVAVAELRGLALAEPVAREVMNAEELETWLFDKLSADYPPDIARDDVIFYYAFDFMPPDTDLWQLQYDLLTEQIAGFYDPDTGRMVVVSEAFDAVAELVYAHEFAHALQDLHFDLQALGLTSSTRPDNIDQHLARVALVEGDATQVMQDYLLWRVQHEGDARFAAALFGGLARVSTVQLDNAPPILNSELLFPYLKGQAFVQAALERGGWALVDAIYARPPLSTEQILHPEAYFSADEPQMVDLALPDPVLSPAWRLVHNLTLGEFYLREYLAQRLPRADAESAAAGWGGDSVAIYANDDSQSVLWVYRVQWDAASHAREFEEAFGAFAGARYDAEPLHEEDDVVCWDGAVRKPRWADADDTAPLRLDSTCLWSDGIDTLLVQGPDLNLVMAAMALQVTDHE